MVEILLDTNFLMSAVRFRVGFEQLKEFGREFMVLALTVQELEKISGRRGRDAVCARIALQLIKNQKIKIIKTAERNTDTAIVRFAEKQVRSASKMRNGLGCMVATNDGKLIKRLENKGIKIIRLRQKKYLVIE
ncbi:MAG: hypothetical protein HZB67_04380 [Candidatus Aenigmarchaeota archaeon]|nr:hypothetical protein [Candidatus Aenigmarchaeota archaeon]